MKGKTDRKRRVLVIDDDPSLLKEIRASLGALDVDVQIAQDGFGALRKVDADPPDLVCLDLMLPDITGYDVLTHLSNSPSLREVPVVVMSGRTLPEERARALELGARAYLLKPFQQAHLRDKVRALLGIRNALVRQVREEPAR